MANDFFEVRASRNTLEIFGDLRLSTLDELTSSLHRLAVEARYPDIILNFRNLQPLTTSVIPPLAAYLRYLTKNYKVEYSYLAPFNNVLEARIKNTGLGHYIDFRRFEKPKIRSAKPALMQYSNVEECDQVSDVIVNHVLRTANLDRKKLAALEWSINEITDNVLNHAHSSVGGFAIYHKIPKTNIVEFTVADCGIGVGNSLGIKDDREAVEKAIQEGVTRDNSTNQGNGLYGSYALSCGSNGLFTLRSKRGNLYVTKDGETHSRLAPIPFQGTIVVCQIDCDQPDLIERSFLFNGKSHVPAYDYLERIHEGSSQDVSIKASHICPTFGSRESGKEARNYISNVINSMEGSRLSIDFEGISVISSSFADEVFAKLFVELGAMKFMRLIHLKNSNSTIEALVDRAIMLRSKTGL